MQAPQGATLRHLTVVALTNTAFEGMSGAFPAEIGNAVYG